MNNSGVDRDLCSYLPHILNRSFECACVPDGRESCMSFFVAPRALGYCSVTKIGSSRAVAPATCNSKAGVSCSFQRHRGVVISFIMMTANGR